MRLETSRKRVGRVGKYVSPTHSGSDQRTVALISLFFSIGGGGELATLGSKPVEKLGMRLR